MRHLFNMLIGMAMVGLSCVCANAQCSCTGEGGTDFSGPTTEDTVWEKSKSPYCITGNITVFQDKTLTIEPGVVVKMCPTNRSQQ